MTKTQSNNWRGYLFVAPATAYLLAFTMVPMVLAGWMALHRWHLLKPEHTFVGLGNFTNMLSDPFFRNAIYNTLVFVAFQVPLGVVSALVVALLVSQPLRGVGVFRTLFYIPAVSSQVALSMVWLWILLPEVGLINATLKWLGFDGSTDFLQSSSRRAGQLHEHALRSVLSQCNL